MLRMGKKKEFVKKSMRKNEDWEKKEIKERMEKKKEEIAITEHGERVWIM